MRATAFLISITLLVMASAEAPPGTPVQGSAIQSVPANQAVAVLGSRVIGPDTKEIGRLIDILVDATGKPEAAIIDFGGFLGVGNRRVAVHWSALQFNPEDTKHPVVVDMTPDQIKTAPEYGTSATKPASVLMPTNAEASPPSHQP